MSVFILFDRTTFKVTILAFLNVEGADIFLFYLDILLFWQKPAGTRKILVLFVDSRFINDSDEFGKMFVARIALAQA